MADTITGADDTLTSTDAPLVMNFCRVLAETFKDKYRLRFGDISSQILSNEIQVVLDSLLPERIGLATTRPDFESNLLQLMREVESGTAWRDTTLSSTGQMILRAVAADIDFAQFAIMRALQEAFPHSARNPTSIIAAARGLGTRIQRNTSCSHEVQLDRRDYGTNYVFSPWTQFITDTVRWFNREVIVFGRDDISVTATLHQGLIKSTQVFSTGVPLQVIEIGEESHTISDVDIRVQVDGVEWARTDLALWNTAADDAVFWENTLPNGNVEIRFGDGAYGSIPPAGSTLTLSWVETQGAQGNDPRTGLPVTVDRLVTGIEITGTVLTPANNGNDRLPIDYYRIFSGDRRAADASNARRAVRRPDFRAHACTYPGVADAVFRGQAELAPGRRSFMNVVGATLLTEPSFTNEQWEDFKRFMGKLHLDNLEVLRFDPTPRVVDIKAKVYCRADANKETVRTRLVSNLVEATRPKIGHLGFNFYENDWETLLRGNMPERFIRSAAARAARTYDLPNLIEYAILDSSITDSILNGPLEYVKLGVVDIETFYDRRGGYEGKF